MKEPLIENVDYYYCEKEGVRFRVFTEKFLSQRGFCCNNKCKHCPYNLKNKK